MKGVKIMGTASSGEWIAILLYFALVIGVGAVSYTHLTLPTTPYV